MNLGLMLYLIDVVGNINCAAPIVSFTAGVIGIFAFCIGVDCEIKQAVTLSKLLAVVCVLSLITAIFTPSRKTMYLIAGANAAEAVISNPEVKKISGRVFDVLNKKLDELEGKEAAK